MTIAVICEKYGWDYYTYMAQPAWFLYLVHKRLEIDSKHEEAQAQKLGRKKH